MDANGVLAAAFDSVTGALRITPSGPYVAPTGLTGATAASRYVGATTSGAPASGTFNKGDFVVAQDGIIWVCTAAGTPGTWVDASSTGRELAYAESSVVQSGLTTVETDITNLSITFTVTNRPVYVEVFLPYLLAVTNSVTASVKLTDEANVLKRLVPVTLGGASYFGEAFLRARIATPGTYTRKARIVRVLGTGSITVNADATTVASIRAVAA